jgi:hypothetical protein
MKRIITLGLAFLMVSQAFSVDKTGTTAAKFLSIGVGSKATSLGGAFTAVADNATAMYWNPAGLSFHNIREVYVNHSAWIADISFDYVGLVVPLMNRHVVGVNITSVSMDEMEVTRYGNENTGETFSAINYAIGLAYATNLTDRFAFGLNAKYIQERIADSRATGAAVDVGTLFTTPFGFRLGTSISNYGPKMNMTGSDLLVAVDVNETIEGNNESVTGLLSTENFDLPMILRVGISSEFSLGQMMTIQWSVDAISPNDNANYINAGLECRLYRDIVTLRGGMNSLFLPDAEKELALGGGLNLPQLGSTALTMNYSFETMRFLGEIHQFGLSLRF